MRRGLVCAVAVALLIPATGSRPAHGKTGEAAAAGVASALAMTAICAALALGSGDDAEGGEGYDRKGWLVGLGGSYGNPLDSDVDDSFGVNGAAGYRCHARLSAEAQVEWLDGFGGDADNVRNGDFEPLTVTANARGYILTGRFQPFLLVGLGGMTVDEDGRDRSGLSKSESRADFVMRFGGGLDFYATKNVVLNVGVGYVYPFGDVSDFDYLSVRWGLQCRF
jgi:opacity protein-like surface antigen